MRTRQTYGPERLQAELREDGFPAGIGRIKRLRKKLGLRCQQVRRFTTTTDSTHALPVADNVLAQSFATRRPNETWVTDITYVPTVEGWLYLAGVKALYICEVVGHAKRTGNACRPLQKGECLADRMTAQLTEMAHCPALIRSFFRHPSVVSISAC